LQNYLALGADFRLIDTFSALIDDLRSLIDEVDERGKYKYICQPSSKLFNTSPHMDDVHSSFGERLALARKMAGLSYQGLADKLNGLVTKQGVA
jgi:hypothetical protein